MRTVDTEVIIIGAGLGGLTSAILLGQMGIKTTIIERSPFPGGLLRSYARQGVDCAVGLHYFGPAGKGELLRQMFDILGVTDRLQLRRLGTQGVLERYIFDDLTFHLPATLPAFQETLLSMFPAEQAAIDFIIDALQSMSQGLRLDADGTLQSSPFSFAGIDQSMEEFLAASGCSKELHDILTVHGFWTGLPMDQCPAYLLLYTLGALLLSAWELGCTGKEMADAYAERALATGVELIVGDAVEHILVDDGRACGVRLKSGRSLSCKKVLAGIHPKLVLPMLPDQVLPAAYKEGLLKLRETGSAVCVHLLVDAKQQEARGYNMFRIHKVEGVNIDGTFLQVRQSERPGYNLLTIIRGSEYSDWQHWYDTRTGNRGKEYQQAKMDAAQSMIKIAGKVLGPLGEYTLLDISTPLTMRDWAASPEGSIYGLMRSVTNDLQFAVLTRMPVRSLYLVGQNAIAPGLLGVTLSVLRGVGEVAGRGKFQKFLAGRLAQTSATTVCDAPIVQSFKSHDMAAIRPARLVEAEALSKISFTSKAYWGYPKEYFDIWSSELTITSTYIKDNEVFVFEKDGVIIAYYSLVELKDDMEISGILIKKGCWLEHMFVLPDSIGKGVGTKMFNHLREMCSTRNISEVGILADPNARGFYERMGCEYKGEYPSTIKDRTTPLLLLKIKDPSLHFVMDS